ncbi:MAG: GAF domain-containing protein [Anaerolineae bacterium]
MQTNSNKPNPIETLGALNEIGASINRMGMEGDLSTTLRSIVENAVRVLGEGNRLTEPMASAVIWTYDQRTKTFDPNSRVSAGEPPGTSIDDYPREDGFGRRAIQQRRRVLSYEHAEARIHPTKRAAGARVLASYPLIVGDEIVGILYVYRLTEKPFSQIELLMLDNFVNLAAMAIYHGRQVAGISRELNRRIDELAQLRRADRLISSRRKLDDTLDEILKMSLELTRAQYGSFRLLDKQRNVLELRAVAGRDPQATREQALPVSEQTVTGWVATHRQSLLIGDLRHPPWSHRYHPLIPLRPMRSELAVPLLGTGNSLEGVLNLESPEIGAFSNDDLKLVQSLATQASIALQEMKLIDTMQEIASQLLSADHDGFFDLVIARACDLINCPIGTIWTVEGDDLVLRASSWGEERRTRVPIHGSLTGQVLLSRQPLKAMDVRREHNFHHREIAGNEGWISALIVPLLSRDNQAVGAFSLYTREKRDFYDWEVRLLSLIADHTAIAINDAAQLRELEAAHQRQATAETFAAVGDIAANLLHRLNNKIGAIPVHVQAIEDKREDLLRQEPYLAEKLRDIEDSARAAMQIARESMTHLHPLKPHPVSLVEVLATARAALPPTPGIEIKAQGLDGLPRVMATQSQLTLVFMNLLENAVHAIGEEGRITVSGRRDGDWVEVHVSDDGPGIAPDLTERIFELSFSTERLGRKLGFGLWWVRRFVQRFGGEVTVSSQPNRGATFTLRLPSETTGYDASDLEDTTRHEVTL